MSQRRLIAALAAAATFASASAAFAQTAAQPTARKEVRSDALGKSIGPFSQAIAAGGFIFCSGQIGLDPATGKLVPGGIEEETRRCLRNLAAVLEAGGSSLEDVVKVTVMLADMADFAAMNKVYATFFKAPAPARATFQAAGLAMGAKVEIECVAFPSKEPNR